MEKLWAVVIGYLLFLGFISGAIQVHGNTPENAKKISRHEMFVATEACRAEATELEFIMNQKCSLLELIKKNPEDRNRSFYKVVVKELEGEIEDLRVRLKELRGY